MTVGKGNLEPQPGGISIGTMHGGAVAQGSHAQAVNVSHGTADMSDTSNASELLAAVTALREQLSALGALNELGEVGDLTELRELGELGELEAQLAAAEGEIEATGRIGPTRLEWLRDRVAIGATAATGLAAAGQAAEQLARLIGGQG
ncbi:hypothetical protein FCH28_14485 [Streptomyces piniterrae]|uniref:Uncharacterized protein n=1 Tax=Streptomyces piniterrae TaxID=2571125 RepID=A0A4V5MKR8_9ACTN|nr:hypothetical protein [Streptomyces piniterrae]TJZ54348.1 hypothetical protein FCH28_14485 [Streptomyces piniterrae]